MNMLWSIGGAHVITPARSSLAMRRAQVFCHPHDYKTCFVIAASVVEDITSDLRATKILLVYE